MKIFISFTLLLLGVSNALFMGKVINDRLERNESNIFTHLFLCIGNALILIGNGLMLLQNSKENVLLCRSVYLFGLTIFEMFCILAYLNWGNISKKLRYFISVAFVIIPSLVFIYSLYFKDIEVIITKQGSTYYVNRDSSWYMLVCTMGFTMIICIIIGTRILLKSSKARARRFAVGILGCNICLTLACLCEIILPFIIPYKFPVSSVILFIANFILFKSIIDSKKNKLSIANISENIYYNVDTPVIVFDDDGKLVFINDYGADFFEIDEEGVIGNEIDFIMYYDLERMKVEKTANNIKSRRTDAVCNLSINIVNDKYDSILGYIVFAYDQTEQYNAIKEIEKSRTIAEQANHAKSDFLANMSHEIRTPINVILGMDEMILRETRDKALVKYASDIRTASNNLLTIINDILDFSKIEAGKLEIIPVVYDTERLFFDVISQMAFKAKEKGLKFVFDIDPRIPKALYGDDVRIKQIMNNLLSNAIKYTTKGRVMISVTYNKVSDVYADIQIAVTDTGCGIKKDDVSRLFEAFTRFDEKHNRTIEGTGLGLKITRELISLMDGVMNVKSIYGKGSTFSCSFRQEIRDTNSLGDFQHYYETHQGISYAYHKTFEAEEASILIVDDNQMNLNVVENLLKGTKMNVVTVLSGKEAIAATLNNKYDLIFMDHMMPEMDGIETYECIKSDTDNPNCKTPCIVMTANAIKGVREMYMEKGFAEYISKPIDPPLLETVLVRFLPSNKIKFVNNTIAEWTNGDDKKNEKYKLLEDILEKDGINVVTGLRNINNNIDDYNETIRLFVHSYDMMKGKLKNLLDLRNDKDYGIEAHALKANARILGAEELASIAYKHEMAGREFRIESAVNSWDELEKEWERVIGIFKKYLLQIDYDNSESDLDTSKIKNIDDVLLDEKLKNIRDLIDDYEHIEAKKAIEELMDYKISDDIKEIVKATYQFLELIDYDNALKKMEEIWQDS